MTNPLPTQTPNVVIENPKARRIARTVLDIVGLGIGTAIVADATSGAFDIAAITVPALAVWTYLRAGFGLGIDNPNTPKL
jgi:hypothetical protein